MAIIPGLVSVSFRQKMPEEICAACVAAGLTAIEWGGDVHVPPDGSNAAQVKAVTLDHGLSVSSYGSYFRVGQPLDGLRANLETACALGTDTVRIWGGLQGSAETDAAERAAVMAQMVQAAETARTYGIQLALEYHGGTLTDDRDSVVQLMAQTQNVADSLRLYWQPRWDWSEVERLASLEDVRPRLSHMHAFTWRHPGGVVERRPLAEGEDMWRKVLPTLPDGQHVLLEFFENDSLQAMDRDARTLLAWAKEA